MKAMMGGFAAIIVISIAANFGLVALDLSTEADSAGMATRLDEN